MGAAERQNDHQDEPATMRTARAMISSGYRPIPILPGKKRPMGEDWGLIRHLPEKWRDPATGLGLLLGDMGGGFGLVDLDIDDPERAVEVIGRLFPDGVPDTAAFRANLGMHYVFTYDVRLAKYGRSRIYGLINKEGKLEGNRHYLGIDIRIGTIDPREPEQVQSLIPPTPRSDGQPREWMDRDGETLPPEYPWHHPEVFLPLPDSVFDDLDRYALDDGPDESGDTVETWDIEDVKTAILPHALELAKEWGLRITGTRPTAKGFLECRSVDRADSDPSCGFNPTTGVYTDRKTEIDLSIFQLAIALKAFPDLFSAVNILGRRFHVKPRDTKTRQTSSTFGGFAGSGGSSQQERIWRHPRLSEPTPAVPFPIEVLPTSLAQLCREGAVAVQCPVDYFGCVAIALAGAALGMTVNLVLKPGYRVAPHLYIAIVGPPGSKKSPVVYILARPFYDIDAELRDEFRFAKAEFEAAQRQFEADRRKGTAGEPPVPPERRQWTMDDVTREAVALIHSENPRGLVVVKDELISWVTSLNAYKPGGKGDDRQFWLSVNSGMPVKVDRKGGSRDSIVVPRPCVTIVGGLTPRMLPSIRGNTDDGWLDRILFSYPEPVEVEHWNEDVIAEDLLNDWVAVVRRLWDRPMMRDESGRSRPFYVNLSREARPLWEDWYNAHHAEKKHPDFPSAFLGPWSKLEGFAARLILILSQLHQAYDPTGGDVPRDAEPLDVWGACKLADYFKAHLRRARNELIRPGWDIPDDASAIIKWLRNSRRPSFSERDVKKNFEGRFGRDPQSLADALAWLIRHECIRPTVPEDRKTGRPHSDVFEVNPLLYDPDSEDVP